jgi:hypothetical protein
VYILVLHERLYRPNMNITAKYKKKKLEERNNCLINNCLTNYQVIANSLVTKCSNAGALLIEIHSRPNCSVAHLFVPAYVVK